MKGSEKYLEYIILGFYKHVGNFKNSRLLSWPTRLNTRLIARAPLCFFLEF